MKLGGRCDCGLAYDSYAMPWQRMCAGVEAYISTSKKGRPIIAYAFPFSQCIASEIHRQCLLSLQYGEPEGNALKVEEHAVSTQSKSCRGLVFKGTCVVCGSVTNNYTDLLCGQRVTQPESRFNGSCTCARNQKGLLLLKS